MAGSQDPARGVAPRWCWVQIRGRVSGCGVGGFCSTLRAPAGRASVRERWGAPYLCCWLNLHRHFLPVGREWGEDRAESPARRAPRGTLAPAGASEGGVGGRGRGRGVPGGGVEGGMGVGPNGAVPGRGRTGRAEGGNRAGLKAGWGGDGRDWGGKPGNPAGGGGGHSLRMMRIPRMKRTPAMTRPPILRD